MKRATNEDEEIAQRMKRTTNKDKEGNTFLSPPSIRGLLEFCAESREGIELWRGTLGILFLRLSLSSSSDDTRSL